MASTAEARPGTARAAVGKPRKLTVAQATEQWAETSLAIEGLKTLQSEAAKVLLDHAQRTGRRTFKDRIAVVQTGGSLVLNQAKVKEELADRLSDFMTRTKLGWSLKLLK